MKEGIKTFLYWFFRTVFPINRNRILFESYYGAQYGCNPKYLSEYIVDNCRDLKVSWAFVGVHPTIKGVNIIKYNSIHYLYELATTCFFVTNYRTTNRFRKRKGQIYIQTWHSSLRLKMIEKDVEDSLKPGYVEMAKNDSRNIDYLISGCRASSEIFRRAFWYDGPILEVGTPRNDFLIQKPNESKKADIKQFLGIAAKSKVVMYAPTFRKDYSMDCYDIDYNLLLKSLKKKFGSADWIVVLRLHPHLRDYSSQLIAANPLLIDATAYPDIQELLYVADVLITDYSSLMFDYLFTKRPCFIYAKDLDSYIKNDRGLYFKISDLPFSVSTSQDDLNRRILEYNKNVALLEYDRFISDIGSYEDGRASEKITNIIKRYL